MDDTTIVGLITNNDETHYSRVIHKLHEEVGVVLWCAVMGQQGKEQGAEYASMGAPVLSVMVLDVLLLTQTACGLPLRNTSSQVHSELLRPKWSSFYINCCGFIMLNAELMSMNSILTYEFFLSRWVIVEWRALETASSVDRLVRFAYLKGSRGDGRVDLMCCGTNHLKHFIMMGVSGLSF